MDTFDHCQLRSYSGGQQGLDGCTGVIPVRGRQWHRYGDVGPRDIFG